MGKEQDYPAIEVRNLTKIYKLHSSSLRNQLSEEEQQRIHGDDFYALKNVSFSIDKGQVVGIVGSNGSGKTTLLQILSKITKPTDGEAFVDGRVSAILDVDSGFHPDLSGRENVFLRGAIMGMKRSEIKEKFDRIVDFSEIRPFIDEPVKAYSNGMFVRLAFSIVAHLESDIVLIDEVISVGDADFRAKSFDKIRELAASGKTVVIISHELLSIVELCQSVILLKAGAVQAHGFAKQVVGEYLQEVIISRHKAGEGNNALIEELRNEVGLINSKIEGLKEKLAKRVDETLSFQIDQLVSSRKEVSDRLNLEIRQQNEGRKLPNSLRWSIEDAPGSTDIRLLSVSCTNCNGESTIDQSSAVCVEMTYQKLTDEPTLPTMLLTYQMSNLAVGGNPLFSDSPTDLKFDTLPGVYTRKCIIPGKTLNVGLFSVGLTFVDQFAEEISQHADLVYFKVDYDEKMFDNYVYNGRFPGPLFLEMDWSLSLSPEVTM
jgi:ABC-type polysaccharide/polyol phosphate transport system ATPase subunit